MATGKGGKPSKEEKAAAKAAKRRHRRSAGSQLWQAFNMQRKEDKLLLPLMIGAVVGLGVLFFLIGLIFGLEWFLLPLGIVLGGLVAFIIFGRRVQKTVYGKAEGQPGAAAWALDNMQGDVAGHQRRRRHHPARRGPPGDRPAGRHPGRRGFAAAAASPLLAQEKKKTARLVGDTPIYDILIGNDEGQVPLSQLQKYLTKLPTNIDTQADGHHRGATGGARRRGGPAMPKGPLPGGAKMRGVQRTVRRR